MVIVACYSRIGKVQVCGCGCVKQCRLVKELRPSLGAQATVRASAFYVHSHTVGTNWEHMHGNKASCGEMGWCNPQMLPQGLRPASDGVATMNPGAWGIHSSTEWGCYSGSGLGEQSDSWSLWSSSWQKLEGTFAGQWFPQWQMPLGSSWSSVLRSTTKSFVLKPADVLPCPQSL